jgi:RNA polymerase sigma-70 factor (ECF subfamily)
MQELGLRVHPHTSIGVTKLTMRRRPLGELGDEELVALAKQGGREAFEVLVERYKHKAYRIAFDFTRDREEAKDLSQEAFLRAFTHLQGFDLRAGFYTWFYRILVNLCLDYRRKRQRTSREALHGTSDTASEYNEMVDAGSAPDREAMAEEAARGVGRALNALPAKQRTAFLLRNHQGLSIQQIAKVMQTAEGTVKVHLHRAVATLRQRLAALI